MKDIKWFPGHMKAALEDIEKTKIKVADAILYVLDARAPLACLHPYAEKIVHHKPIIYIFNKIDLADEKRVTEIQRQFETDGKQVVICNSSSAAFKTLIKNSIKKLLSAKIERNKIKGVNGTYKLLVLGVPNTGKSTLINMLSGQKKAKAGNIAGVTKANQWVKIDDDLVLLDTPGILWPKFDEVISKNLAYIGCLSDKEFDLSDLGFELMNLIYEKYPENLKERFEVDFNFDAFIELYDRFCVKRGYIMKKGEIDYNRAGKQFIDEFRAGKFGKITLD